MQLITDLERIKRLAAECEDENWEFRTFLKWADISERRLDTAVRRHYEAVRAQIDCTRCGNCCREMTAVLSRADLRRLASCVGSTEPAFVERHLEPSEEKGRFKFKARPCPFLVSNKCCVYDARPRDCRSYPHLHKQGFVFRLMGVVSNCSVCPIVFNVYEALKADLWRPGRFWQDGE